MGRFENVSTPRFGSKAAEAVAKVYAVCVCVLAAVTVVCVCVRVCVYVCCLVERGGMCSLGLSMRPIS